MAFWSTLHCSGILYFFFSVEDLTLLVSGLAQLLELSISEMFGDFHTTDDQF